MTAARVARGRLPCRAVQDVSVRSRAVWRRAASGQVWRAARARPASLRAAPLSSGEVSAAPGTGLAAELLREPRHVGREPRRGAQHRGQ